MEPLNIYEWMLLNGDRLADAIREDGQLDGPKSRPILTEAQQINRPGRTWDQARKLLQRKLRERGLRNVLPE